MLSALNSSATPSSSHTYLTSWLNKAASANIEFPPGTVRVVFNNEQVIGKRYRVKTNQSSVPTSVVTSAIYLSIDESSQMQIDEYFKLSNWMFDPVDNNLTNVILESFERYNDIFRLTPNYLLPERMSVLINSQEFYDDNCFDFIDSLIQNTLHIENVKICSECKKEAPISTRIRKSCKGKLVRYELLEDDPIFYKKIGPYSHFSVNSKKNYIKVIVDEPNMLNPNSLENLASI